MEKSGKSSGTMAELIQRMKSDRGNMIAGGTPEEAIRKLESELGFSLPPSYAEFLRAFDGGEFGFARMHTITHNGAGVWDFRHELRRFFESAPWMGVRNLLPFANSYGGDVYCFDLAHAVGGEPPVVMYDHEDDDRQDLRHEADSFLDWTAGYYRHCDKEPHRVSLYVACDGQLAQFAGDDVSLDGGPPGHSAVRFHMSVGPDSIWAVDYDESKQVAAFLDRALAAGATPIDLFVFDDMEMNSDPRWRTEFAKLKVAGKPLELHAGDYYRLHASGEFEVVPRAIPSKPPEAKGTGELCCNFCGAGQHEVKKLIAGPNIFICDGCVGLCDEILSVEMDPA